MQRQATPNFFSAAGKRMRKKRDRLKNFCINTDHLGNTRVSFQDADGNGSIDTENEVVETNDYYPYGMLWQTQDRMVGGNLGDKFRFGGREQEQDLGLNSYAFGARNYNPELGRWFTIDPLAELMRNQSPYNFGFNNPIYFSDYAGTIPWPLPEVFKNWVRRFTSGFGMRTTESGTRVHYGGDINYSGGGNTDYGAPIVATHSGRVCSVSTTNDGAGGRFVNIESPDGTFSTRYLHLSAVAVQPGQEVNEGQTIGLMGGSGYGYNNKANDGSGGKYFSHLHYEIRRNGYPINPLGSNGTPIDPQQWIQRPYDEATASFYGFLETPTFIGIEVEVKAKMTMAPMQPRKRMSALDLPDPNGITPTPSPQPTPAPGPIPSPVNPAPTPPQPRPLPNPCNLPDSGC